MPYIKQEARNRFDDVLGTFLSTINSGDITPGELNYVITNLCGQYLQKNGKNYDSINDIIGVLECSKQEFYRRVAVGYEEEKALENGDIKEFDI